MPLALFAFGYFWDRVLHLYPISLDCDPPIYPSCSWDGRCIHYTQLLLVEMESCEHFIWPWTPSSWPLPTEQLVLQAWTPMSGWLIALQKWWKQVLFTNKWSKKNNRINIFFVSKLGDIYEKFSTFIIKRNTIRPTLNGTN
jgi:hypothetical protein